MSRVADHLIRNGLMPGGMFRSRPLLDTARDAPCMNCAAQDGTIVAAHENGQAGDKGVANKAHDHQIAFMCHRCHSWLDQGAGLDPTGQYCDSREAKQLMWNNAHRLTWRWLWAMGKVRVAR